MLRCAGAEGWRWITAQLTFKQLVVRTTRESVTPSLACLAPICHRSVVFTKSAQFAAVSLLAAVLVACAGGSGPPHSKLVDLTLPAGSTHSRPAGRMPIPADEEPWDVPLPYIDLVAAMRKQLPLHRDFEGVPWCDQNEDSDNTTWLWQKVGDKIQIDIGGDAHSSGITITRDHGGQSQCVPQPRPKPPELSTAGNATVIGLWFKPADLTFSSGSNKLYVSTTSGKPATYVVSMSALTQIPPPLDKSITDGANHIAVNNKLKLGYALHHTGALRVFNTDTDKLMSTTEPRSCHAEVLAVDEATGTVYGGGLSATGECLVEFDSAGRLLAEKDVAPASGKQNRMIQRIAADPASGDVIYTDPYSVGRADHTLTEKWRSPAPGVSTSGDIYSGPHASDMGYEPSSATVYVCVSPGSTTAPATIASYDGNTGRQTGQFNTPASTDQFAADQQGRVFVALANSRDLYVLDHGVQSLTKFETLPDVPPGSTRNVEWLAVDSAGHRLFVNPGDASSVYQYQY
jgi:hypothetical protein